MKILYMKSNGYDIQKNRGSRYLQSVIPQPANLTALHSAGIKQ